MRIPQIWGFIPARLHSSRLPNKPLALIGEDPLIWHVYRAARDSGLLDRVQVVTDSAAICAQIDERGGNSNLVTGEFCSGTERVAAAARSAFQTGHLKPDDLVLNIQGDEPFLTPEALNAVILALKQGASIATLSAPLSEGDLENPSAVKVVCDVKNRALYFSRAPIPGQLHVGIYGFKLQTLLDLAHCPRGPLAERENLEQLAWLYAGYAITVANIKKATLSINTPEDLQRARALFSTLQKGLRNETKAHD